MKKLSLLLSFLFISQVAISQSHTSIEGIVWGRMFKDSRRMDLQEALKSDSAGFYVLKVKQHRKPKKRKRFLEYYDDRFKLIKSSELKSEYRRKTLEHKKMLLLNGQLYVFASIRDSKKKKRYLYYQNFDKETLRRKGNMIKVSELDYSGGNRRNSGNFNIQLSNDSSKILVYYNFPYEKNKMDKYGLHLFDGEMNELWNKEVTVPYADKLYQIKDYHFSNKGEVYVVGKLYNKVLWEKRKGEPNFRYHIMSFSETGEIANEYPIDVEGRFLSDMTISIDDEGNILCGGFYSERNTNGLKGSYFLKIDGITKNIVAETYKDFSIDFITQNLKEKKAERMKSKALKGKEYEMRNYDLRDLIINDDGSAILIGEQYYVTVTTTSTPNGGSTTHYHYHYNDIIVVKMSESGDIEWTQKVAKRQRTTDDYGFYSSYCLSVVGDDLYFIFNDNGKNLTYSGIGPGYKSFNKGKKTIMVSVKIDSDGNIDRQTLFKFNAIKMLIRPKVCQQVSANETVLYGRRKKNRRFGRVIFKQE